MNILNKFRTFSNKSIPKPFWLISELTYKCPLQCPYCSNPVEIEKIKKELNTNQWIDVFKQARDLGAVQLGLSGGEPLLRKDIDILVKEASQMGFYTNLITSSIGLNHKKLDILKSNGLKSIQISFQAENENINNKISGSNSFKHKMKMIKSIKNYDLPLTLNVVIHRHNIDSMKEILDLCLSVDADYIELANTQYYGWAKVNKDQLLPSKSQVMNALEIVKEYQEIYKEKPRIFYVYPDYIDGVVKPCMSGWGQNYICLSPDGYVLPCLSAKILPGINFPNILDTDLKNIWENSKEFNKFRGFDWMESPCKSCDKRFEDFGGCRCQAFMLTGNMYATDPVCKLSPLHDDLITSIEVSNKVKSNIDDLIYRNMKNSKKLFQKKNDLKSNDMKNPVILKN